MLWVVELPLVSHDHSLAVQPSGLLSLASTLGLEVLAGLLKELADVNSGGLAEVRLHLHRPAQMRVSPTISPR